MDESVIGDLIGLQPRGDHLFKEGDGLIGERFRAIPANHGSVGDDIWGEVGGGSGAHTVEQVAGGGDSAGAAEAVEEGVVGDDVGRAAVAARHVVEEAEGVAEGGVEAEAADDGVEGADVGAGRGAEHAAEEAGG